MNTTIRYSTNNKKEDIYFMFSVTWETSPINVCAFFCSLPWVERNKNMAPIIDRLLSFQQPCAEMTAVAKHLTAGIIAILEKRKILAQMRNLEVTKTQLN